MRWDTVDGQRRCYGVSTQEVAHSLRVQYIKGSAKKNTLKVGW